MLQRLINSFVSIFLILGFSCLLQIVFDKIQKQLQFFFADCHVQYLHMIYSFPVKSLPFLNYNFIIDFCKTKVKQYFHFFLKSMKKAGVQRFSGSFSQYLLVYKCTKTVLIDKHSIPKTKKAVFLPNCFLIRMQYLLSSGQRTYKHH